MKSFKNHLRATGSTAVATLVLMLVSAGQTAAQPQPVIDREFAARNAVQHLFSGSIPPFRNCGNAIAYTVPTGKRLVIEQVSVSLRLPSGEFAFSLVVATSLGGGTIAHSLLPTKLGTFGSLEFFTASQPVRIYADPGTDVIAEACRPSSGETTGIFTGSISGYLVPIP